MCRYCLALSVFRISSKAYDPFYWLINCTFLRERGWGTCAAGVGSTLLFLLCSYLSSPPLLSVFCRFSSGATRYICVPHSHRNAAKETKRGREWMKMLFAFLWVKIQNDVMTLRGRCSLKGQPKQKKEKHNTRECAKPKTEIIQKKQNGN